MEKKIANMQEWTELGDQHYSKAIIFPAEVEGKIKELNIKYKINQPKSSCPWKDSCSMVKTYMNYYIPTRNVGQQIRREKMQGYIAFFALVVCLVVSAYQI